MHTQKTLDTWTRVMMAQREVVLAQGPTNLMEAINRLQDATEAFKRASKAEAKVLIKERQNEVRFIMS